MNLHMQDWLLVVAVISVIVFLRGPCKGSISSFACVLAGYGKDQAGLSLRVAANASAIRMDRSRPSNARGQTRRRRALAGCRIYTDWKVETLRRALETIYRGTM
jgi:hypothetical protein